MGYLYRPRQTKRIPPGAELFTRKGERFARYTDGKGRTRTAKVTTTESGQDRLVFTSLYWRYRYRDGSGQLQDIPTGCKDEAAAKGVANRLGRRAELVKAEVITPGENDAADHVVVPLPNHIDAYIAHLRAKGNAPRRISMVRARLDRLRADCRFSRLTDLNAGALERWLVDRQAEGMSAATRNGYREALVGFGNWCRRTHRLIANPFMDVPIADTKSDRRHQRRAMTEDELSRLLAVARQRPLLEATVIRRGKRKGQHIANIRPEVRNQLDLLGRERALIYKTFVLTGLRKSELASLTVARVDLEADVPYIVLNPEDEKNRQGADIPLRDDLAQDLRLWLADKLKAMQELSRRAGEPIPMKLPPNTPLFYVPTGLIRIFDRDLVAAGIAQLVKDPKTGKVRIVKQDDRGRTIDVHALRTTFGTHLSKGGVAPRTAQAAMRHSDIKLTMGVYTDPKLLDVRGALNVLPALPLDGSDPTTQSVTMTGTDSAPVQNATSPIALPIALPTGQSSTTEGKTGHQHATGADSDSPTETAVSATPVNKNGSESTVDPEPSSKRVMGLEPTTFTLAT